MIPISQQEDDEIEDQTFIPPKKNEENEKFPFKKTIIKSIFFIFIIIILIISYLPKKKSTGYNIQNVPDKKPDNKEAKEIEEDKTYDLILLSVNPEQVEGALLQVKRFAKND